MGVSAFAQGGQELKYYKVKAFINQDCLYQIAIRGVPLDHLAEINHEFLIGEFSETEVELIRETGAVVEILIDDLVRFYQNRNNQAQESERPLLFNLPIPENFNFGSMGGFLTLSELEMQMDSMTQKFPNLITPKTSIGNSLEGRPMWMVKISDNPNLDENEPEVLFTALHHAREPQSMMQLVYFMHYLLDNYGTDPAITYLVNNREIYFVPVVNPDGYVYNEQTNPQGGGMWRKNMRDNGDGTFGVDLNRNYSYKWGENDLGSSPNTNSALYRGTVPFSEPETQNMRDFILSRNFHNVLNYHTYGDYELYPWGFQYSDTQDSALFNGRGRSMTAHNEYRHGPAANVLYEVNGEANDWLYGETAAKPKMYGMTPEVGRTGFWPTLEEIIPLAEENLPVNLLNVWFAGEYVHAIVPPKLYHNSLSLNLNIPLQNLGSKTINGANVSLVHNNNPYIISVSSPLSLQAFASTQHKNFPLNLQFVAGIPLGTSIETSLRITLADGGMIDFPMTIVWGVQSQIWQDDFNDPSASAWGGTWGFTDEAYYTNPYSFTDSPYLYYTMGNTNSAYSPPINLAGYLKPVLRYKATCPVDLGATVKLSVEDLGTGVKTDFPADQALSRTGANHFVITYNDWTNCEIDLSDFVGKTIVIHLSLNGGILTDGDGFYIDDMEILGIPSTPTQIESEIRFENCFVYPNPTQGRINIQLGKDAAFQNLELHITDMNGMPVFQTQVREHSYNLPELHGSMYFYRFEDERGVGRWQKLIVE